MASSNYRQVMEDVFGVAMVKQLWTAMYTPAIPAMFGSFPIGGVIPAIMYLARWGHRRGNGRFFETYQCQERTRVTAADVVGKLRDAEQIVVDGPAGEAILADLLIGHCFATKNGEAKRDTPILRAYPVHYLSSWLTIDETLRNVPELLTALLANQPQGDTIGTSTDKGRGHFMVGGGFDNNLLLRTLGPAMTVAGHASSLTSDRLDEEKVATLTIEQVLTARIALLVGEAPEKMRGTNPLIPNQQPLAGAQSRIFQDDLRIFLEAYHTSMPWQTFVSFLEVGIGIGLSTTFLASAELLFFWEKRGSLPDDDRPWPIFVDVSNGSDRQLRQLAEESLDRAYHAMESLPVVMSTLRVLDIFAARSSRINKTLPEPWPNGRSRINFLGDIHYGRIPQAQSVIDLIDQKCLELADELEQADLAPDVVSLLRTDTVPVASRLGEGIVRLMGPISQERQYVKFLTSCFIGEEGNPHSLLHRRTAQRNKRKYEARSFVLGNVALDYLVHRNLWKNGSHRTQLTFTDFIAILRDNYGFFVDQAPPGMTIPSELLLRNRWILERRLRDLGLLIGVNDAESMKFLRSRLADNVGQTV